MHALKIQAMGILFFSGNFGVRAEYRHGKVRIASAGRGANPAGRIFLIRVQPALACPGAILREIVAVRTGRRAVILV